MNTEQQSRNQKNLTAETQRPQRNKPENRILCELRVSAVKQAPESFAVREGFSAWWCGSVFICVHLWFQFCAVYADDNSFQPAKDFRHSSTGVSRRLFRECNCGLPERNAGTGEAGD